MELPEVSKDHKIPAHITVDAYEWYTFKGFDVCKHMKGIDIMISHPNLLDVEAFEDQVRLIENNPFR